jgi:uncharacterized membrane protein
MPVSPHHDVDIVALTLSFGLALSTYALCSVYQASDPSDSSEPSDPGSSDPCDASKKKKKTDSDCGCSDALQSDYGRVLSCAGLVRKGSLLDQPNALYGILYYVTSAILYSYKDRVWCVRYILLALSVPIFATSCTLTYVMFVKLRAPCLICLASFLCSSVLLYSHSANLL